MKHIIVILILMLPLSMMAKDYSVNSPDGRLEAKVNVDGGISYSLTLDGREVLSPSFISLSIDKNLGVNPKVSKVVRDEHDEVLSPIVRQKNELVRDHYTSLILQFRNNYSLEFRLYNDGMAYRWSSSFGEDIVVMSELVEFNFPEDYSLWFPEEVSMFSHQERGYKYVSLSDVDESRFASTPLLVDGGKDLKVFISEANLRDYPGMFLKGTSDAFALEGKFAGFALETKVTSDRNERVTKHASYLAKCSGKREFPWRVIVVSDSDAGLVESEMIYKLGEPNRIEDPSWIKPGMVAWDWWNYNNIYGVDFEAGVNTATYKYYIDFASEYGLEYIILDEGWYYLDDVLHVKEEVDVEELIQYGESKDVGVILWVTWKALNDKLDEALDVFEEWGAKGIKVDFMQRDDQWMVNYYWDVAEKAAEHKLLVDYHGAYKPTGLRRTYPNVITREGVRGLEQSKWSTKANPEHDVTLPFTRMVAGPLDYTPGAMLNATMETFDSVFNSPMSLGTRCHQLGMYVIYESPLQMLADNPSNYYREPQCMEFLSAVPTVWDETKVLDAKVADYIFMARRSGDAWYMGAMTDWTARELECKLDFLGEGKYTLRIWKDGKNAHRHAADFAYEEIEVSAETVLKIDMAPGGGWVGIIEKVADK